MIAPENKGPVYRAFVRYGFNRRLREGLQLLSRGNFFSDSLFFTHQFALIATLDDI